MSTKMFGHQIGKQLMVERKHGNKHDVNAVAVKEDGVIVGYLPQAISHISWFFLKHGGHIVCWVTRKQRHGDGRCMLSSSLPSQVTICYMDIVPCPRHLMETLHLMHKTLSTLPTSIRNWHVLEPGF